MDGKQLLDMEFRSTVATQYYHRLAKCIGIIRGKAQEVLGDRSFDEYFIAQFFILYGAIKYDTYDFRSALPGAGLAV